MTLSDRDWEILLQSIEDRTCTPFLGAGACYPKLKVGSEIARSLAAELNYPLDDRDSLPDVSQFVSVLYGDSKFIKRKVIKNWFEELDPPDFTADDEPHALLADLPLPLYITTNYDDFMKQALHNRNKNPTQVVYRWNDLIDPKDTILDQNILTPATPVVFHIHGRIQLPESLLITQDDYLEFIVNFVKKPQNLPDPIKVAFTKNTLLFIGYSLKDWNFRVLFHSLVGYLGNSLKGAHMSVQLVPLSKDASAAQKEEATQYLDKYFKDLNIRVFWGTARDFAKELRERMK